MIERNIDCRKHRKSTHLASADLDSMTLEGKNLIFKIQDVRFETGVDVSGTKQDGYFCKLEGVIKEVKLNSENRKTISSLAKNRGFKDTSCYNIGNWKGIVIELFVDRNVKMMGKIVDGIRIRPLEPITKKKLLFSESKFEAAKKAGADIETIKKSYEVTKEIELKYNNYGAKK